MIEVATFIGFMVMIATGLGFGALIIFGAGFLLEYQWKNFRKRREFAKTFERLLKETRAKHRAPN